MEEEKNVLMRFADHGRTDKNSVGGHNYFETYERLFAPLRDTDNTVMEIGVDKGGSMKLWSQFFRNASIVGIDKVAHSAQLDDLLHEPRIELLLECDAYSSTFFDSKILDIYNCDVIIDDGPHTLASMLQFIVMYSKVLSERGVLVVEDVQSMEWIDALRSVTPAEMRPFIEVYDLRHIANRWDDILFVINLNKDKTQETVEPIRPRVHVSGIGGLGNTLYQFAVAIDYCENTPGAEVVLVPSAEYASGTAESKDRRQALRDKFGEIVPYGNSIFSKIKIAQKPSSARLQTFHNNYGAEKMEWDSAKFDLEICGYQQHSKLFLQSMKSWNKYFSLDDKSAHLKTTYGKGRIYPSSWFRNCVCIGIRRCDDFKHKNAITNRVINRVKKQFYPDCHALVVSDIGNANPIVEGDELLDFNFTMVNEPDVTQLALARLCPSLILSESTFHAWLGYFMEMEHTATNITCFNNTDLTNRNLTLPNWRHVDI